jgi:aspartyl-tRNA(Asn)/glutamyl-tRNA(Gln) amidotransferase subunit B
VSTERPSEKYEAVIGLEIHAQLLTHSKLFCSCSTQFGLGDNESTCPICTGMPGSLPVLNKKALEFSIRTGLALNCNIRNNSVFARKNYFYPDLPKGYQISQYEEPLCENGKIEFVVEGQPRIVSITRAHMEEDAGKSSHSGSETLVNLNRSSVPLLEIVSGPDMKSPAEAAEYARTIRSILLYLEVNDGNLEEGSMRCDCNVSVRRRGETKLGTKVELKNINSFRFVEKAIEYEIERQIDQIENGEKIIQETRLYDSDKNRTYSMRTKEEAQDYRYFPDPDLLPVQAPPALVESIRASLPELPLAREARFQSEYGIPQYDAHILTASKAMAEYFEDVAKKSKSPKLASNWIMSELMRELNNSKTVIEKSPVRAESLAKLIQLIEGGTISGKIAKTVFEEMFVSGKDPDSIIQEKGLIQVSDHRAVEAWVNEVVDKNPSQAQDFRAGKDKLFGFFVGQVMKMSKGQANPEIVNQLLLKRLKGE